MRVSKAPQRAYQICSRCVMDTSDPWIVFDYQGRCNHCIDFLERRLSVTAYSTTEKFPSITDGPERLWASIPRNRGSYDVVVGVSGGVDSSSVALLAQKAGLRVLAVHLDNGWDTPIALQNVLQLAKLPGITYEAEVLNWNRFKAVQRAFIAAGVPDIELPTDIAIQAALHRAAVSHGIRTILSGGNIANEGILPVSWMYNPRDSLYAESILHQDGLPSAFYVPLKFGFRQELRCRLQHRIRTLYPLNKVKFSKESARQHLTSTIGWQSYGGKHCESTYTRFCQLIYQPRRHGIDYRRSHLSADICLGQVTRHKALTELARPAWSGLDVEHDVAFVARKLGYTPVELEAAMDSPPRWYVDFPHRKRLLGLAYNSFRLLTGRQKASNF
jgi:hypothetical protein